MITHSIVCRIMAQSNCPQSIETCWSYLFGQQGRSPQLFLLPSHVSLFSGLAPSLHQHQCNVAFGLLGPFPITPGAVAGLISFLMITSLRLCPQH